MPIELRYYTQQYIAYSTIRANVLSVVLGAIDDSDDDDDDNEKEEEDEEEDGNASEGDGNGEDD